MLIEKTWPWQLWMTPKYHSPKNIPGKVASPSNICTQSCWEKPRKPNKKTVRFSPVKRRSGASTQTKWKMTTPRSAPRNSFGVHFPFRLSVGNFPFFAPFKNLIRPAQGSFKPIHFPKFRLVKFKKKNILNHHLPETLMGPLFLKVRSTPQKPALNSNQNKVDMHLNMQFSWVFCPPRRSWNQRVYASGFFASSALTTADAASSLVGPCWLQSYNWSHATCRDEWPKIPLGFSWGEISTTFSVEWWNEPLQKQLNWWAHHKYS